MRREGTPGGGAVSEHWKPMRALWRDDRRCSGAVCVRGTRIGAEIIAGRFSAGDSIGSIAEDYGLLESQVHAALWIVIAATFTNNGRGLPVKVEREMARIVPHEPAAGEPGTP